MSKFSSMKLRTKIAVGATAGAAVLAGGGAALAYFSTSSTGTGSATVGSQVAWTVSALSAAGGNPALFPVTNLHNGSFTGCLDDGSSAALTPGAGVAGTCTPYDSYTYSVHNSAPQTEHLTGVTISVSVDASHAANGCLASWYTVDGQSGGSFDDTSLHGDVLAGHDTGTSTVTVMLADNANNIPQDSCQGATLTLTGTAD